MAAGIQQPYEIKCMQPQCFVAPCPVVCFDATGKIVPRDTTTVVLKMSNSGKIHNWLPIIGLIAAGALIFYFKFFRNE